MIKGIGIDIIELDRIEKILNKTPHFCERILTSEEIAVFNSLSAQQRRVEWIAGRFAAKEAFSKALGTGIGKEFSFQSISILNDENGRPVVHQHIPFKHSRNSTNYFRRIKFHT
ncbi:MAG: 4-phosphopantetheinyl transferase [Bacillales bacterium]|nr:4-phosphopantetheinyl transferase [Bacillales bacterium]